MNLKQKKSLVLELAKSSCLANRERIWQLIKEIDKEEIEKDKDFAFELVLISMKQIGQMLKGERIY